MFNACQVPVALHLARVEFGGRVTGRHVVVDRKTIGEPWENGDLMGIYGIYPLVMNNIAMEHGH